jgi:hypothetical protein
MAYDPALDELSATTLFEIYPNVVQDNFFNDVAFLAYIRDHCLATFGGGSTMQQTFLYAPLITNSYGIGSQFNLDKIQTIAGTRFDPKYYVSIYPEYMENIDVLNVGPNAVFSLLNLNLANMMNSICADVAIAMSLHGQPTTAGITGNRPYDINGWIEAMNDGITPGWEGSVFPSYGGQLRNGAVGSALNSIPRYCGDSTTAAGQTSAAGALTYSILEEGYWDASVGRERPNLGVCSKRCYAYIKEKIQPLQRGNLENAADAIWGVTGVKMNDAIIFPDDYFPSAAYGKNDSMLGNYLTSTFTVPSGFSALSGLPVATAVATVGEVFAWFNTSKWQFRLSSSPRYQFGFWGFYPAADSTKVVARTHAACNLICTSPRHNKQFYGINA